MSNTEDNNSTLNLEQALEKIRQLQGKFYSTFSQVWQPDPVDYDIITNAEHHDYKSDMTRNNMPDFPKYSAYKKTLEKARDPNTVAKDELGTARTSSSSKASSTNTSTRGISVFDIFGEPKDHHHHIAHLVPAGPSHASLHYHVAKWVFGYKEGDSVANQQVVHKLIHGVGKTGGDNSNNKNGKVRRIDGTGLKHFACNKICVAGQATFLVAHPCLLIVPILTLEEAKDWKGRSYEAVVMIDKDKQTRTLGSVAQAVGMVDSGAEATPDEISKACHLLRTTLLALAQSLAWLHRHQHPNSDDNNSRDDGPPLTQKNARELVNGLMTRFTAVDASRKVFLPKKNESLSSHSIRVRKITFAAVPDDDTAAVGHPAPDPILLAVKAGVVWSKFHEQQLLAGGEISDDDSGYDSVDDECWSTASIPEEIAIPMDMDSHCSTTSGSSSGDASGKVSPMPGSSPPHGLLPPPTTTKVYNWVP